MRGFNAGCAKTKQGSDCSNSGNLASDFSLSPARLFQQVSSSFYLHFLLKYKWKWRKIVETLDGGACWHRIETSNKTSIQNIFIVQHFFSISLASIIIICWWPQTFRMTTGFKSLINIHYMINSSTAIKIALKSKTSNPFHGRENILKPLEWNQCLMTSVYWLFGRRNDT